MKTGESKQFTLSEHEFLKALGNYVATRENLPDKADGAKWHIEFDGSQRVGGAPCLVVTMTRES